jgi:uncharacterized protein
MSTASDAARRSVCPACGAGFGCGAGSGRCWCVEVELPEARLRELAERHDGCLCPDCLARLVSADSERAEAPINAR